MKRFVYTAAALLLAATIGSGCSRDETQEKDVSIAEIRKEQGYPVKVVEAETKMLDEEVHLSGTVEVPDEVYMTPEVGGEVIAVYKDKGDHVKKGEPMLQIKKDDYELGYRQARAAYQAAEQQLEMASSGARSEELEQARNMLDQAQAGYEVMKKNYNRVKELYEKGVTSKQELDNIEVQLVSAEKQFENAKEQLSMAKTGGRPEEIKMLEAQVERAKAAMEQAELMLERTTVKSTVSGVIAYRMFKLGESVGTNNPIYNILVDGPKKITFTVNEKYLQDVKKGNRVIFNATGIEDTRFEAEVVYISRFVRKQTREAELEAVVTKEPVELSHGMFVEGKIILPDIEAFVIPYKALRQNKFVLVIEDGKGSVRECGDTERIGDYIEIKDDCVKPGELVVAQGQGILEDGMKVEIKETMEY